MNQTKLFEQATKSSLQSATAKLALIVLGLMVISGCSPAEFQMHNINQPNQSLGAGVVVDPGLQPGPNTPGMPGTPSTPTSRLICDDFSFTTNQRLGIKGSIYVLDDAQPRYDRTEHYIKYGHELDADLFLSHLFVPTRLNTLGFSNHKGEVLTDDDGKVLTKYFAVSLESQLKLGSQDTAGMYQIAVFSDDGMTLLVDDGAGNLKVLAENEGNHGTQFSCGVSEINLSSTSRTPFALRYFQGPPDRLALGMMWRKVGPTTGRDSDCSLGVSYFDDKGQPTKHYKSLLARGWKPLSVENFELMPRTKNLCI